MDTELSFNAETFLALPIEERVQLCRRFAQQAQELADSAAPNYRADYLDIARSWLQLATEMERAAAMEYSK
jgi:hypothetical protein